MTDEQKTDENVHETAESGDGQIAGQNVPLGGVPEIQVSEKDKALEELVLSGKWQPSLHEPMWGISDGKPHEFVMRQGGIISMRHKTDPDWFNEHVLQMQAGAKPIDDAGIYAPTKALIEKVISAKYPETR